MKNFILSLGLLFTSIVHASDFPDNSELSALLSMDSDSEIHGPSYEKIVQELNDLEILFPESAQVIVYGNSVSGKPLTLIKIARKDRLKTHGAVYIGGSIHGDEYLNIEDRLPRWFLEQTTSTNGIANFVNKGGVIYIAPILNPDGYDRRRRANDHDLDLNRDYTVKIANVTGLTQPETSSLAKFLDADLKKDADQLKVAMDYHCCIGAMLYPWSFTGPSLPHIDKTSHGKVGEMMQDSFGRAIKFGTTPDILGYSAHGTSKDFYYEHFGALGFTFEGRRGKEDKYFDKHGEMWMKIISDL